MSGREEIIERQDWMGGSGEDGIMTRSLAHLFAATSRAPPGVAHVVRCTYLEIYNEAIYDLLSGDNETQLQERWEPQRGFYVPGLRAVECDRLEDALAVVSMGTRNRRVGSHELNKDSSRSHSIMTVSIETHATRDGVTMSKFGKVSFIDLAGSERLLRVLRRGGHARDHERQRRPPQGIHEQFRELGVPVRDVRAARGVRAVAEHGDDLAEHE